MVNEVAPRFRGWRNQAIVVVALVASLGAGWAQAALTEVYRFYHLDAGRHFYTASASERQKVLDLYPRFVYEGVAFFAETSQVAGTVPVYRFYHQVNGSHVYTASEAEKNSIQTNYPVYYYEGIQFYAEQSAAMGAVPLFRLYNTKLGNHFFTTDATEATHAVTTWPWFVHEGAVFYVRSSSGVNPPVVPPPPPPSGGNMAPTISLASTASSVTIGQPAMLTATAADADGTIAKVSFYNFGVLLADKTSAPFTHSFVSSNAGVFSLTAVATDNLGATTTSNPLSITVTADVIIPGNASPTVSLSASPTSIALGSTVTLSAMAADADGTVVNVAFYSGATQLTVDATAPFGTTYTPTSAGTFSLTAAATDNAGARTTSAPVLLTVTGAPAGNVPPTVSMTSTAATVATGASVTLNATAADADGTIANVRFYSGTTQLVQDAAAPYSYVYSPSTPGTFALTAVATDNVGGMTTSAPVSLTVTGAAASTLPRITLSMSSSLVAAPSTVTLNATATAVATGATVSRVSFFVNGVNVLDDMASPYTFAASINAPGTYSVYATVTDSLGQVTSTLTQSVVAATAPPTASTDPDVWRLLNQATFGASQREAARVVALGIPGWINDQLTKPISGYPDAKYNRLQLGTTADCNTQMPSGTGYPADSPQARCVRDHLTLAMIQRDFFTSAVSTAPTSDQLRQRVAWALSQILVTSGAESDLSYAHVMSRYQNMMFEEAFGNFEQLLLKVTYNPAMGNYLDMVNNDKPSGARVPNENYAREIMQLFTIGLEELNLNGTPILDVNGKPIPTYDEADIVSFSRTFTGYTYASATAPGALSTPVKTNTRYYGAPMIPTTYVATSTLGHDTLAKTLLNGTVLPAGQTAKQDIDAAVRNVFMHPNTGPFISKQLIQRLVTGNPAPAYVARVASVFNNNGSGVRGDMAAVVKAILLDAEARGPAKTASDFGTLKEPVLMVTGLIRALNGATDGSRLEGQTGNLGQRPYYAPTVFNYFPPDTTINGTSVLGPEFAIHTTTAAVGRSNLVYTLVYGGYGPDATIPDSVGTRLFLAPFEALADNPVAMVAEINKALAGGQFPVAKEATIVTAVNSITLSSPPTAQQRTDRARMAVYLMASSYDYQVQR